MHPVKLLSLTARIHIPRRPALAVLGALMLGTGVVAFGVSPALPDVTQGPIRQVVEPLGSSLALPDLMEENPDFSIHQSQLTRRDETLQTLLKRLGVEDRDAQSFLARDATSRSLLTGASGNLVSVTRTPQGRLKSLSVRSVDASSQRVNRLVVEAGDGVYASRLEQPTPRRLVKLASLSIRSSFYAGTDQAGVPDVVAAQTIEAFSGDLDFQRSLQRGARFSLIYEAFELDGEILFTGQLLGAEIQNGQQTHQAMWFQAPGTAGEFVSLDGSSQQRTYLASPLAFSRVTSSYGPRIHPVYGGQKAHKGTDYGAPAGTPIRTVAEGVVSFAGRQGGYGNYVVVRHPDKNSTAYAHMERISVKAGQRVQQGQTIGAVGSTGTATGPNLHFEYLVKGVRTNPSQIASKTSNSTTVAFSQPGFQQAAKFMREQFELATSVALASAQ